MTMRERLAMKTPEELKDWWTTMIAGLTITGFVMVLFVIVTALVLRGIWS